MVAAIVQSLPAGELSFGHCFAAIEGATAGDVLRISNGSLVIYCRLAWDLKGWIDPSVPGRVALDACQRSALSASDGLLAEVTRMDWSSLPVADFAELRLTRWSGPPAEHSAGLPDFLRSSGYLLYPGLTFGYKPLGESGTGEFMVTAVKADGEAAEIARVGDALTHVVQRVRGVGDWPPTYDDIGGLEPALALVRREIELPLRRPREAITIGVTASSGVLLYGPPGTGKTLLARAVAHHSGARTTILSGSELASRPAAEAETIIRAAFASDGGDRAGQIVIIDDIDYVTPTRATPGASLLGLIQRMLDEPARPVVIATTSRRDEIDPAIRRLGRIGQQIMVPAPNESDRRVILAIHTRGLPLAVAGPERGDLLADLARRTAGFVGADLEALCHEAGRLALRRAFPIEILESGTPQAQAPLQILIQDWHEALTHVTPSAIGDVVFDVPPTSFADVAGLNTTITSLTERLVLPLSRPQVFAEAGLRMERGVLLYGPPGSGKTLLARAIAHECRCRFMLVRGPELLTKWFGESERAVRELFERARSIAPCVVFFDEIEAIARRRSGGAYDGGAADRVVNQLLAEIDGFIDLGQVAVIGATNDPQSVDPALLRPGRLGLHIEVPLPDTRGRRELLEMYLESNLVHEHAEEYVEMSKGMSGADIAMIAREARLNSLRRARFEQAMPITHEDIMMALRTHGSFARPAPSAVRTGYADYA